MAAMTKTKKTDTEWTHGCTERINRLHDQYYSFKPSICIERALSYTRAYKETENETTVIRRAKALKRVIEEKTISIQPDELIVGTRGSNPRSAEVTPETYWRWIEREIDTVATRPQDPYSITEEQKKILKEEIFPYWKGKSMEEFYDANVSDELKNIVYDTGIIFGGRSQCGPGTISADYADIVLKKGFKGVQKLAEENLRSLDPANTENFTKKKFLEAVLIICKTVQILGKRHADKAKELANKTSDKIRKEELLRIAKICDRVPYNPPETFREAIQAVWFNQMMMYTEENSDSYTMGRLDQNLYPFYEKDRREGKITEEEAQELLECLWIKAAEIIWTLDAESTEYYSGYQPFHGATCGGVDKRGSDATNELSHMMVQASMDIQLHCPSLAVRIHPQTPDDFISKVIDLICIGTGQPSVHFDPNAIAMLLNKGVSLEDARNWAVVGCIEPQVPGKTYQSDEASRYTFASAVELVIFNGKSRLLDRKVGLTTGNPRSFKSYEEFKEAVKKQLTFIVDQSCLNAQMIDIAHQEKLPKPYISCIIEGCVENGVELTRGGAKYNGGLGIEATGLADLSDSVAAVKKLVFDDGTLSMDELVEALDVNFEGHEDIRNMLINKAPKYGNDIDEVDYLAQEFADLASDVCRSHRIKSRDTTCCHGLVSVSANVSHGVFVWALPSGKMAKEPLADGCGPFMGYDKEGPTSVIKSVCKLSHSNQTDGTLLNMKFNPGFLKNEASRENFKALIKTEMMLGGYHVQFNVVDNETLLAAQKNPEKYQNLMVRVAGYSARFVDLHKDVQDSIIHRTEYTYV